MPNTLLHKFVSAIANDPNTALVRPTNWNDEHTFTGGSDYNVLSRLASSSDGAAWLDLNSYLGGVNVLSFGALGNGSSNDVSAISSAQSAAISAGRPLLFPGGRTYVIGSNLTLTQPCIFMSGAVLSVSVGVTLTLNCLILAGRYGIITNAGTLAGTLLNDEVFAEWFGLGTSDDGPAFNNAITLCRGLGGRVTFGPLAAAFNIATTINITKGIFFGCPGAILGTPSQSVTGPVFVWTGGASPIFSAFSTSGGAVAHNFELYGFNLNNTGTATVGIDIATAGNTFIHSPKLTKIGCTEPTVKFSAAGIRCSGTAGNNSVLRVNFNDLHFRDTAPIGLELSNVQNIAWLTRCSFLRHVGIDIRIGNLATCTDIHLIDCETHQDSATAGDVGIEVIGVEGLFIDHHYFEIHSSGAGSLGLRIPATANTAKKVIITNSTFHFNSGALFAAQIALNAYQTSVNFKENYIEDANNDGTAFIDNDLTTQGSIRIEDNHSDQILPLTNSLLRTYISGNTDGVSTSQFPSPQQPVRLDSLVDAIQSVTTTETDLYTYTIPANLFWRIGQSLVFRVNGRTGANANAKQLRFYFNGVVVLDSGSANVNNLDWFVEFRLQRSTGTNVEGYQVLMWWNGAMLPPVSDYNALTLDWATAMIVKVTGQGTANSDLVSQFGLTEFYY